MERVPSKQQGAPPPEAAKAETRLKGHIGHLTKEQEAAFTEFKKICVKEGLYKPETATSKPSIDDATLMYASAIDQDHR